MVPAQLTNSKCTATWLYVYIEYGVCDLAIMVFDANWVTFFYKRLLYSFYLIQRGTKTIAEITKTGKFEFDWIESEKDENYKQELHCELLKL